MRLTAVAIQEAGDLGKASFTATATSRHCSGEKYQPWRRGDLGKASFTATATSRHCPRRTVPPGVAVLPCQVKPFPERLAVGVEGVGALVGGLTQAGLRLEQFCYCHHPCLVVALDPAE